MKDEVTIVVPCKNEESYIYYLLDSLKKQKGMEGIRILIADCSTDNTRRVIENHKGWLNIKIISKNNNEHIGGTSINVGNPHVVFFIDNIEDYDLKKIGPEIENHNYFPEKCNVTLAKVINRNLIKVKVWERGAGLTKACGTAACATVAAANINGLADKQADIEFALGKLTISIDKDNSIHMKGPVSDIKNIEIKI